MEEWVYQDDQGVSQGPFPSKSVVAWIKAGFFLGSRLVRAVDDANGPWKALKDVEQFANLFDEVDDDEDEQDVIVDEDEEDEEVPPEPANDQEAIMSEYYRTYYKAMYEQLVEAHRAQNSNAKAEEVAPPDDGYVVPQPVFQDYAVTGRFAKGGGRFFTEGQGGASYWESQGRETDREGRQLAHYMDVSGQTQGKRERAAQEDEGKKQKKKSKEKEKKKPAWLKEDPLEGAF